MQLGVDLAHEMALAEAADGDAGAARPSCFFSTGMLANVLGNAAGLYVPPTVSGVVWEDANADGVRRALTVRTADITRQPLECRVHHLGDRGTRGLPARAFRGRDG